MSGTYGLQVGILGAKYDLKTQYREVLDEVVAAGYGSVEYGIDDIVDPEGFRVALGERGLVCAGVHTTIWSLQDVPQLVRTLRSVGCLDVCNSGILNWDRPQVEDFRAGIAILNESGKQLRDLGMYLHYHNHAFEFDFIDSGTKGIDAILDGINPSAVDLCVDVAWVQKGGEDPVAFLGRYSASVGYLHLKDYAGDAWKPLGQGVVNVGDILTQSRYLPNLRQTVVEQDSTTGNPVAEIAASLQFLARVSNEMSERSGL
ncbi:MAG TPA: sugar phosphate isomerase/epimerase [Capsulimonadaceae bacterium]|jgi:sugar phosphate isomerase/epimerase